MNSREKFRELCKTETSIPVFSRDWWMDAVCGENNWDVLLVEKEGHIIAAMPYLSASKLGCKSIIQPQLTQTNGVWIKSLPDQKSQRRLAYENEVMKEIIQQLGSLNLDIFQQCFHYSITNWLPFYWNGYKQTTLYTYVLDDLKDIDKLYYNLSCNIRSKIRKAKNLVQVKEDCDIKTFYEINKKTFDRQEMEMPYSLELVKRIDEACLKHECRKIFYAEDNNNEIHAAVFIIWDENSAYCLLSGGDPNLRNSGATSLILWHAIQFASKVTKKFDFEGSMIEPIERFFRAFGAEQKPYFKIYRSFGIKGAIYTLFKDVLFRYPRIKSFISGFIYGKNKHGRMGRDDENSLNTPT